MISQDEAFARNLVLGLYHCTSDEPYWWSLPDELSGVTRNAIRCAADRGWILVCERSMRLTTSGREFARTAIASSPP